MTVTISISVYKIFKGVTKKLLLSFLNKRLFLIFFFNLFIFSYFSFSQESSLSVSLKGNYTTTSRYYPSTVIITSYSFEEYYSIDNLWGYGIETRYNISDYIALGLSAECISGKIDYTHPTLRIPAKAGYDMFLFELNGYYYMPLSTESFKFYIGGGINLDYCNSYEELPSIKSQLVSAPLNTGIQVISGVEYFFMKDLSIRLEMKFRDPIVENECQYTTSRILYNNRVYNISTKPFKSKVNIDGVVFDLSVAYKVF